ncbi:MAG: hypothetical protein AAFN70_14665 [Planctomycetota bacterium]
MIRYKHNGITRDIELPQFDRAASRLISHHRLDRINRALVPTIDFLRDLAAAFGVATATEAWQLWILTNRYLSSLQDQRDINAELSFWYGFDVSQVPSDRRDELYANLSIVQAQERIHRGDIPRDNPSAIFDLVMLATGDETAALKARAAVAMEIQRRAK